MLGVRIVPGNNAPEWWFYHLERTTLEHAVGPLLEKCLERGWRVLAVSERPERRAALDEALWTYADGSFLAHGRVEAEGLDPADQPVLISDKTDNLNEAAACLLMDGAEVPTDAMFERCMVMFDGGDGATRDLARQQFKAAKDAGHTVRYFQQTGRGGWKEAGK
ncbi:MAG: DNA polymerase III subunit chi [Pseudomonadota bacterium]